MDPINYAGMTPAPDFAQSIGQGLQIGAGFQQLQQRRAELEKAQLAAQRTAQFRNEVGPALQAGDPAALVQLFGKYPDFGDQIKQASGFLNDADENNKKTTSATVYNGLQSGNVDIAKQALQSRVNYLTKIGADANEWKGALDALNSGDPDKMKQVQQQATLLHALYNPKAIETVNAMNTDRRAEQLQPGKVREGLAAADEKEADAAQKNQAVIASTLGSLEGKGAKISQVETALRSLNKRGVLSQEDMADYLTQIPVDARQRDSWLGSLRLSGVKPEEQTKLVTPDANSRLSANTQIQTTGMNNATQLQVQDRIDARTRESNQFKVEHGTAGLTDAQNEALYGVNGAVTLGKLDPNKINGKTARLYADAALKNPSIDFGKLSAQINAGRKADADFTTGKTGNAVRSFNVGLAHLETLDNLATALNNKDTQLLNRIGNEYAAQTGDPAPTSFNAAKKVVGDEIVKAIVGAGGGVSDREEIAKTLSAANSPAQLKAVIRNYKELMAGQLGGLQKQYTASTGRDDFDKFLSPEALKVRSEHAPKPATPKAATPKPAGGVVNFSDLK